MNKNLRQTVKILLLTVLVGIGVALTYFYFEAAVRYAISFIWDDVFSTEDRRLFVVPLCLVLTLAYFGAQHVFDRQVEAHESQGLGDAPKPTVANFIKVLGIGFLSLIAGASLGPEAILVPACVMLGSFVGIKALGNSKPIASLFGVSGFIALFAAFFNSFIVGLLALLLIKQQFKTTITTKMFAVAVVASGSTAVTLGFLKSSSYVKLPDYTWKLDFEAVIILALIGLAGYGITFVLKALYNAGEIVANHTKEAQWWLRGLIAATGLSTLYLLGGPLVEFTGNESIVPMLEQSAELGFIGLIWLLLIKLAAIGWSKANGYRGGLIFPTVFAASILVAVAQLYTTDINFIYGLLTALVGALIADKKAKILL